MSYSFIVLIVLNTNKDPHVFYVIISIHNSKNISTNEWQKWSKQVKHIIPVLISWSGK